MLPCEINVNKALLITANISIGLDANAIVIQTAQQALNEFLVGYTEAYLRLERRTRR